MFDEEFNHRDQYGPLAFFSIPLAGNLFALFVLACVIGNKILCGPTRADRQWSPLISQIDDSRTSLMHQSGVPAVPHGSMMMLSLIDPLKF